MTTANEVIQKKIDRLRHQQLDSLIPELSELAHELGELKLDTATERFLDWFINWDHDTIKGLTSLIRMSRLQGRSSAEWNVERARTVQGGSEMICELLDHNDQKFKVVIQGIGNPAKPVHLCGCGKGIRVGQSRECPANPKPGEILVRIGVEP